MIPLLRRRLDGNDEQFSMIERTLSLIVSIRERRGEIKTVCSATREPASPRVPSRIPEWDKSEEKKEKKKRIEKIGRLGRLSFFGVGAVWGFSLFALLPGGLAACAIA